MAANNLRLTYQDALEFQRSWDNYGGDVDKLGDHYRIKERMVRRRREHAEETLGIRLLPKSIFSPSNFPIYQNRHFDLKKDYTVVIGSDKHNKPGHRPQAFNCFVHLIEDINPEVVLINGDWFDFPTIGRHHRIGWEERPSVEAELEDGMACLREIEQASPKSKRFLNLGNHDMRFDGFLSNRTPELEGVKGNHLEDYIDKWKIGLSVVFNQHFMTMHRFKGGDHAGFNETMRSGVSTATGHDDKLYVRGYTDFTGTRYGMKTGTLSDLYDTPFLYTENNPVDWQPGFLVVTISGDVLIPHAVPVITRKTHPKHGKAYYGGKWYG